MAMKVHPYLHRLGELVAQRPGLHWPEDSRDSQRGGEYSWAGEQWERLATPSELDQAHR